MLSIIINQRSFSCTSECGYWEMQLMVTDGQNNVLVLETLSFLRKHKQVRTHYIKWILLDITIKRFGQSSYHIEFSSSFKTCSE